MARAVVEQQRSQRAFSSFRDLRRCRVVKGARPGLGNRRHAAAETALHRALHRFGTPTEGRTARRVALLLRFRVLQTSELPKLDNTLCAWDDSR